MEEVIMTYTPREALTVALFNANVEPLHAAYDVADTVMAGLHSMGYAVVDECSTQDSAAQFVEKTALRILPTVD